MTRHKQIFYNLHYSEIMLVLRYHIFYGPYWKIYTNQQKCTNCAKHVIKKTTLIDYLESNKNNHLIDSLESNKNNHLIDSLESNKNNHLIDSLESNKNNDLIDSLESNKNNDLIDSLESIKNNVHNNLKSVKHSTLIDYSALIKQITTILLGEIPINKKQIKKYNAKINMIYNMFIMFIFIGILKVNRYEINSKNITNISRLILKNLSDPHILEYSFIHIII
jgi:hypothetical protein